MSIEVHIDWKGASRLVGLLHTAVRGSSVTFEYSNEWLKRDDAFAIDPTSLPLQTGALHSKSLFSGIQDCGPDRWGRVLIERAVRKNLLPQQPYNDLDHVLVLDDNSRIGALRFRRQTEGPFLADSPTGLPPLIQLSALLNASDAIHTDTETAKDLEFLLGVGSPLGGARPKSAIVLPDTRLAIAKFPKPDDTRDIAAGEILALTLAEQSGIQVAEHRLVPVGRRNVAVITRFDRAGAARIPFLSAASLVGASPDAAGAYTMIADGIRQFGDDVAGDLRELWRRLVFSLLTSNNDDHLRNHGFLMLRPGRWSLSPGYDMNPVPKSERSRTNKTSISEDNRDASIATALSVSSRFGLHPDEGRTILGEVFTAVATWRDTARRLRFPASTIDSYASAFEHECMEEAKVLLRT